MDKFRTLIYYSLSMVIIQGTSEIFFPFRMVKQEVRLVPIAMAFDLRIVAAPAIVYTPPAGPLCGHQVK